MNNTPITWAETRGTLVFMFATSDEPTTVEGWFCIGLNGRTVAGRKIGGRNRRQVCALSDVIWFTPAPTVVPA